MDLDVTATDYSHHIQILSQHCDGNGIVHFPRYAEMAHTVVENWFDEALDWSFARMSGRENSAVPVVASRSEYPSASRLGDNLIWRLTVEKIGNTSVELALTGSCGADRRALIHLTLVHTHTGVIRPRAWPDPVRARMADYMPGALAAQ